jgi:L-rhamnose mutarotase
LPDEERTVSEEYWAAIREEEISIPRWWKLVRHLELGEDDEEISPIEAFTNLTSLNISNCHLIDISPLAELTNLTSLTLVKDLAPFSIEPLSHLTRLVSLRLAVAELSNVDELAELKNLEKLDLSYGYDLTSIDGLVSLKKLTWLSLEECRKLKDLTPLSQLTALKYLNLSNCTSINDVSALAQLNQLEFLDLAGCEVLSDLTPLGNLTTLKEVRLDGDFITNLATLTNLKQVNRPMERLRYILSQDPGSDTWEELIECLENWSDSASFSAALDYAEQQLTSWFTSRLTASSRQWQAIREGAPLPRWWKLVKHIELGVNNDLLTTLPAEVLENIISIKLKNNRVLSPEELRFLASINKLGAMYWSSLLASLEACPADEPIDDILDAAEQQLSDFPDKERTVLEEYWADIREGEISIPRWWKLVRYLKLGKMTMNYHLLKRLKTSLHSISATIFPPLNPWQNLPILLL